jgi:hypothetical protein
VVQGPVRRWSCRAPAWGWSGALPRRTEIDAALSPGLRAAAWGLPSLAIGAATVALGGAGAWGWKKRKAASLVKVGPHQWAPGEHFEDDPLPANHPLNRVVYRAA